MANADKTDEVLARDLLQILQDDEPEVPPTLPERTIRKVQAELTSRDLIDLTTFVFLTRFCAPFLDLIFALFGYESRVEDDRRTDDD